MSKSNIKIGRKKMIKKILKKNPKLKTYLLTALIVSVVYAIVKYFELSQAMVLGVFKLFGYFAPGASLGISLMYGYIFLLIKILAPIVIIYLVLVALRRAHAFKETILCTMLAAIPYSLAAPLIKEPSISIAFSFFIMFIAYLVTIYSIHRIKKERVIWVLAVALIALNTFAIPYFSRLASRQIAVETSDQQFASATKNLDFVPYYPSYAPEGLIVSEPELDGYRDTKYFNKNVTYDIGKIEFRLSKKLVNQDEVLNFRDNCDISKVWSEMRSAQEVDRGTILKSRDNLSICKKVDSTKGGLDLYAEGQANGQYVFYFMAIGDANIVARYDQSRRPSYAEDFEKEIIKIFSSMQKLNNSQLTKGT